MFRKVFQTVTLPLLAAILYTTAFGAQSASVNEGSSPTKFKSQTYNYPDENNVSFGSVATERTSEAMSLGSPSLTSPFVGVKIGDTYYEMQHHGRMPRMVDWGNDIAGGLGFMVHFEWMRLSTEELQNRHYSYNVYYAGGSQAGTMLGQTKIQPDGEYAGYVSLDVTNDGRAVLGGQNNQGGGEQSHTYWDFGPGFAFFGMNRRIPDTTLAWATGQAVHDSLKSAIWPSIRYQEGPYDTVLHVFTQIREENPGAPQAIAYFRKVGRDDTGEWDYPPYLVDTVFDIAQDVACSNVDGKVALVWIANLPDPGDCDTCSSQTGRPFKQWDNDVYYQISNDQGATFLPRVNLTMNVDGEQGYRPYADLSALIGSNNDLGIAWNGRYWAADANQGGEVGLLRCRMFYWGENLGMVGNRGNIRTAADLGWNQTDCNGGAWQLNGSKMTISECDGKLYYLWTQFNNIAAGIEDDCAERAYGEDPDVHGAANGELYLAVSDDGGLTWDQARNLTNTYTPHCDPAAGPDNACRSEHWASMSRFGTNLTGDMSGAYVLDPSGGYTGDHYLDVQYIGDTDPGSVIYVEGSWQQADVMWFRLPCVEPEPFACVTANVYGPIYANTSHGVPIERPLELENYCNLDANYTMTIIEETGPSGWLTTSFAEVGVIPAGGTVEGTITMNTGGIVNDPGTYVQLEGALVFEGDFDGSPLGIYVSCDVIPPIYELFPDTVNTSCLSLIVRADGNFGNQGVGRVNMDFFNSGDCDADPGIPGNTEVYLYDGSPVICWQDGDSVLCNWSIFGDSYASPNGFLPVSVEPVVDSGDFYFYQSEFTTRDSGIGVVQSWYAPKDQPTRCQYLIHRLQVFAIDGQTHTGLAIGEIVDWDIPSDSGIRNNSGFSASERLLYQQGSEYDDDDGVECQENSDRYGGISLLEIKEYSGGNTVTITDFYGAYTADNATQVYPMGGLVADSVWQSMGTNEGYVMSPSTDADLHSVMTYKYDYTLTPTDTIDIYTLLTTTRSGFPDFVSSVQEGHAWHCERVSPDTCGGIPDWVCGDFDGSGDVDMSDMVYVIDWLFTGGPPGILLGAELDGYELWTLSDKYNLYYQLMCENTPIWELNCPNSVGPPLGQTVTSDVVLRLSDYSFPANATSVTLDVWVHTYPGLRFAVMPFNIRVDGEIPVANLTPVHESFYQSAGDSANGVVQVDMFNTVCSLSLGIGAGSYHVAQLQLVMPTPSPLIRDVVIAWDSLETAEVHYPFVVMSDNSDWRPTIRSTGDCCVGKRDAGADGDLNISTLVYMVDFMFSGGPVGCYIEMDVNCDDQVDIADLVYLVDCMFTGGSCDFCDCPPPVWQ